MKSSFPSSARVLVALVAAGSLPVELGAVGKHDVFCSATLEDASHVMHVVRETSPGDAVVFHGRCLLNDILPLLGDRTYRGTSRTGTILTQPDGQNLDALAASDSWLAASEYSGAPITLERMSLDGNRKANARTHGVVIRSWLTTLTNMYIANCPGDGVRLDSVARDGLTQLTNTQVNSFFTNLFIEHTTGTGFHVVDPMNAITDSYLTETWISDSGRSAVYLENAAGWTIERVHTYDAGEHAIFGDRCSGTAINDNYIEDFGSVGGDVSVTWFGIACRVQSAGTQGSTSIIANNKVWADMRGKYDTNSRATLVGIGVPGVQLLETVKVRERSRSHPALSKAYRPVGEISVMSNNIRGGNRRNSIGELYAAIFVDKYLGHSPFRKGRKIVEGTTLNIFSKGNAHAGVTQMRKVDGAVNFDDGSDVVDTRPSPRSDLTCNLTRRDSVWSNKERWGRG